MSKAAAPVSKRPGSDVSIADYVAFHIDASPKNRAEIAAEAGFAKPNVLSMIRTGVMKVPLTAIGKLAKSLGIDQGNFMRRCLSEYSPELLDVIEETTGGILSTNERKMLELYRSATKGTDPAFNTKGQENDFVRAIRDILMP